MKSAEWVTGNSASAREGATGREDKSWGLGELQREEIDRGKRWRTGSVREVEDGKMDTEIRRGRAGEDENLWCGVEEGDERRSWRVVERREGLCGKLDRGIGKL